MDQTNYIHSAFGLSPQKKPRARGHMWKAALTYHIQISPKTTILGPAISVFVAWIHAKQFLNKDLQLQLRRFFSLPFHISRASSVFRSWGHCVSPKGMSAWKLWRRSLLRGVRGRLALPPSSTFTKPNRYYKLNNKTMHLFWRNTYLFSVSTTLLTQTHWPSVAVSLRPSQNMSPWELADTLSIVALTNV